jgi:carboxypeptidase D
MMVNSRRSAGKDRVIFWFNVSRANCDPRCDDADSPIRTQGGPGCSSFDGSLMEVGPFRTIPAAQTQSGKVELKLVEGGWEEFATIVFGESGVPILECSSGVLNDLLRPRFTVDQPPGTGFSTVPTNHYLHELSQVSPYRASDSRNTDSSLRSARDRRTLSISCKTFIPSSPR